MTVTRRSHGTGAFTPADFAHLGEGVVFEPGVLVFHADRIHIGDHVYVGHQTILKGYHAGTMTIGAGTWIGQQCFFHSAGNIHIGANVGIGPGVRILTSQHEEAGRATPILHSPLKFAPVTIEDDVNLGMGTIVLPGVTVGRGAQTGAGSVVARDVPPYAVAAGNPARVLRMRP